MCGNGVRCVAKYIHDHGLRRKDRVTIETGRGVLTLDSRSTAARSAGSASTWATPILEPAEIPDHAARRPARSTPRSRSTTASSP